MTFHKVILNKNACYSHHSLTDMFKHVFLILFLLAFFGLKLVPVKPTMWDYPLLLVLVTLVLGSIRTKLLYSKLILLCVVGIFGSCVFSHFHYGQALHMVVVHSYKYLSILFFFYLLKKNISAKDAKRLLITVAVICCVSYIVQWLIYPTILYQGADSSKASELSYRVRIPGSICCYCLFFYGANRFLLGEHRKSLLYMLLGFLPILMMGFRSLLSLSFVSFFLMIPFTLKTSAKTISYGLLGAVSAFLVMQTSLVQYKIAEMERRNEANQTFENDEYVRWIELDYYWNEQFNTPVEHIVGGGVPTDPTTQYAKTVYGYAYEMGLYWNDLGLVGLSMIIGIPAVLLFVVLYILCIWRLKEPELQYLRFTLVVILAGSIFTTAELYRDGNLLLFSLFLYIEYKYHQEKESNQLRLT